MLCLQHDTPTPTLFVVVEHWPEDSAGLEEGYNRAWLSKVVSRHDTYDEAEAVMPLIQAHSEFDYTTIVSPEWYLEGLRNQPYGAAGPDDGVPF